MENVLIGAGIALGVTEATNETVAGVMWAKGIESDNILKAKYSFINLLRIKSKSNKKTKNEENKYYESNSEMIWSSKLSRENIKRLLGFVNNDDNSFLDNIHSVHTAAEMFKYDHYGEMYNRPLTEELIKKPYSQTFQQSV